MKQKDVELVSTHRMVRFGDGALFCRTCFWYWDWSEDLLGSWDQAHYNRAAQLQEEGETA